MKQLYKKTIIVGVHTPFTARYFLYSGIIENLLKNKSVRIIILTKLNYIKSLKYFFNDDDIIYCELNEKAISIESNRRFNKWTSIIFSYTMNIKYDIDTVLTREKDDYYTYFIKNKSSVLSKIKYLAFIRWPLFFFRRSKFLRKLLKYLSFKYGSFDYHSEIYAEYNPEIYLSNSLGFRTDQFLINEAKKNGIKTISSILNWDNTSSKGTSPCNPEKVIVWNEKMKDEVINHHEILNKDIFIGGVPHYDIYFKKKTFCSNQNFYEKYELNKNNKNLLFCLMSPTRFKYNPNIVKMIAELAKNEEFSYHCNVIARLHPLYYAKKNRFQEDIEQFSEINNKYDNVTFQYPKVYNKNNYLLHKQDMFDLADLINHSSVLLCFFSTINIEGAILNKPVINLFLKGMRDFNYKPEHVLKSTHLKDILDPKRTLIAYDKNDLVKKINYSLRFPNKLSDGRKWIVDNKIGPNRGNAAKIISDIIYSQIDYPNPN